MGVPCTWWLEPQSGVCILCTLGSSKYTHCTFALICRRKCPCCMLKSYSFSNEHVLLGTLDVYTYLTGVYKRIDAYKKAVRTCSLCIIFYWFISFSKRG